MRRNLLLAFFVSAASLHAQGLLNNGAHIVVNGAPTIYLSGTANYTSQNGGIIDNIGTGGAIYLPGDWVNNSTNAGFSNDGTGVTFNGSNQSIGGSNSTSFHNVTLLGTGNKTLNVNTSIGGQNLFNGALSLGTSAHPLVLNGYRLTITNSGPSAILATTGFIVSETNAALNPSIVRWNVGMNTGNYTIPFGAGGTQIPFSFNITSPMSTAASSVDVATRATASSGNTPWASGVSHMFDPSLAQDGSDEAVIDRWWELRWTTAATANLTFSYLGSENTLAVPYNVGNVGAQYWDGAAWRPDNATIGSSPVMLVGVGSVTASGVSFPAATFTPMILSSFSAPLPIEMLSMKAVCDNGHGLVSWTTATELNNDYFTIERSDDGATFRPVGTVDGAGTSMQLNSYNFSDAEPIHGIVYYRIRQTDFNGQNSVSGIMSLAGCGGEAGSNDIIDAFSWGNDIHLVMDLSAANEYSITLMDAQGKIVATRGISAAAGQTNFTWADVIPATGIYLVTITGTGGERFAKRIYVTRD